MYSQANGLFICVVELEDSRGKESLADETGKDLPEFLMATRNLTLLH